MVYVCLCVCIYIFFEHQLIDQICTFKTFSSLPKTKQICYRILLGIMHIFLPKFLMEK